MYCAHLDTISRTNLAKPDRYTCDYVDGDGGAYPTVRAATNQLGRFEDIIHVGMAQPIGAAVGILYSETADIYYDSAGT
eukprot:COSAG01_NODE_68492_length_264_cov_0.600000_1_plen_78_part_10